MTSRFKIRCLSLFILFMSLRALGQGPIIPYRIGNNWGFTDTSKNIIIEPQYQAVNVEKTYPEGYYLVKKNDKWSVVTKNKEIIPAQLNDVMFEPHDKFIIDMLPDGKLQIIIIIEENVYLVAQYRIFGEWSRVPII